MSSSNQTENPILPFWCQLAQATSSLVVLKSYPRKITSISKEGSHSNLGLSTEMNGDPSTKVMVIWSHKASFLIMFVLEAKLRGSVKQFAVIDEMIRTAAFVRNRCIRHWMDHQGVGQYDLSALCAVLAKEYEWAKKLNSQARQASAERAWQSIKPFYENCQSPSVKKKGYPKFKKARSVEYKTTGWKLSEDRQSLTFTDGFKAGTFRMRGAFDLNHYQPEQIKRVRVVRRADGYYVQFCLKHDRLEAVEPTEQVSRGGHSRINAQGHLIPLSS